MNKYRKGDEIIVATPIEIYLFLFTWKGWSFYRDATVHSVDQDGKILKVQLYGTNEVYDNDGKILIKDIRR